MKIVFFSDVHGSVEALDAVLRAAERLDAGLLVMLGDALYHGPRNPLRPDYAPANAAPRFNAVREKLIAVRGNCDSEVDQLLLKFPMMGDYATLFADGRRFFLTHGHLWDETNPPPVPPGTVLAHGHTHLPCLARSGGGLIVFNPGSVALPKGGNPPSFGFWRDGELAVLRLDDATPLLPPLRP